MRPHAAAQHQQLVADLVDAVNHGGPLSRRHGIFQLFQMVGEPFQHGKVRIDDGIDQGVGQVIRLAAADAAALAAYPVADRIETVARPLLEGQHIVFAQKDTDLFRVKMIRGGQGNQSRDNEQMVAVRFHLGPLVDVDHILQGQGMQPQQFADGPDRVGVAQAIHVDPGDHGVVKKLSQLADVFDGLFDQLFVVEGEDLNDRWRRVGGGFQGAGEGPRLSVSMKPRFFPPAMVG